MASHFLKCRVDVAPFANIIHPSGEVDLSTVSILGHVLATAFSQGRHVIVDLSEVTYIDSTGFRELLAHRRIYRESDRLLILANATQPVQTVIDRLNLYEVVPVFPSIESAKHSLKVPPRRIGLSRAVGTSSAASIGSQGVRGHDCARRVRP